MSPRNMAIKSKFIDVSMYAKSGIYIEPLTSAVAPGSNFRFGDPPAPFTIARKSYQPATQHYSSNEVQSRLSMQQVNWVLLLSQKLNKFALNLHKRALDK